MQQSTKIAVAGATGRVGRPVVEMLESRGYDVVPISRSQGVDVITGEGLDQALTGVETIIDVATHKPIGRASPRSSSCPGHSTSPGQRNRTPDSRAAARSRPG